MLLRDGPGTLGFHIPATHSAKFRHTLWACTRGAHSWSAHLGALAYTRGAKLRHRLGAQGASQAEVGRPLDESRWPVLLALVRGVAQEYCCEQVTYTGEAGNAETGWPSPPAARPRRWPGLPLLAAASSPSSPVDRGPMAHTHTAELCSRFETPARQGPSTPTL